MVVTRPRLERATRQHSPLPSFANSISRRVSLTRRKRRSVAIKAEIKHHIIPLLQYKRVDALTRADLERLLINVKAGKTAAPKARNGEKGRAGGLAVGGSGVAGQCVTLMSTILSFAVKRGLRPDNPAQGIEAADSQNGKVLVGARDFAACGRT